MLEESIMPSAWWLLGKEIDRYLKELEESDRSPRTIENYCWSLKYLFQGLRDAKLTINPRKVGRRELEHLRKEYLAGTESYRAYMVKLLRLFLKWAGNKEVASLRIGFRDDGIHKNRWLTDEEAMTLKMSAQGVERMVVHCELDLGMRRIEVMRLRVNDFQATNSTNTVLVHGKGRYGGKYRTISWHPDTPAELEAWLNVRDETIRRVRERNPGVSVPDNLLLYARGKELHAYNDSGIDAILKGLSERTGVRFSNHDLRRTCGRMMHRSGVRTEEIARIFGHSDTRTTLKYLGLDHEDMSEAMAQYAQYQKAVVFPKVERIGPEPDGVSGPNRI
jgi:integrase